MCVTIVQDVAEHIDREARRRGQKTQVLATDAFDLTQHQKEGSKLIFVASTTGQVDSYDHMASLPIPGCLPLPVIPHSLSRQI